MEEEVPQLTFTKDVVAMFLVVIDTLLILVNVISAVARLHSHAFKIPVQYMVADGSITMSSSWYSLYSLAFFVFVTGFATLFLAYSLHKRNRIFAIGILAIYFVIAIISFLVINALLGLVGRV